MAIRRTRKAKSEVKELSEKERERLVAKDIIGWLTDEEIVIAKKFGIYRFDGMVKGRKNPEKILEK